MRGRVLFWVAVGIVLFIFVFPILWIYIASLKPSDEFVLGKIAFSPTLGNYYELFFKTAFFMEIRNTAIIAIISTVLVMVVAIPAAYSFARFNTGSGHLLFVTISTRMFPGVVAAIPFFFAYKELGLLDTHFGLILLFFYFNLSFATFLLFGFYREIPAELEQAAMVDGYGRLEIFWKIVFPLVRTGVAVTTLFCLVWSWNEFLYAFLFTRTIARTVSVGISAFWGSMDVAWGPMAAAMALAIIPTLLTAWFIQRYMVYGMTFGAVKG